MAYKDFQEFISTLDKAGQLKHIKIEVSSVLEITEIADRVSKQYGPALLFEKVAHSPYPLAINTMGTYERMHQALQIYSLDAIGTELRSIIKVVGIDGLVEKIKMLPMLLPYAFIFPVKIKHAPCQEVIEEPDLDQLPILKCWPQDGGRFITLPIVITKDPETHIHNLGMYRLQVYDKKTTGMHWHLHKDGKKIYEKYRKLGTRMPVAVAIGADPATMYAATAPVPGEISEYLFSGFLRKKPVELVKCVTNDLYVPAHAEFILEGYVDLDETRLEGPFGDHTGYYSLSDNYPVFHIECMTRKKHPIYPATIVGKPPMEDCYIAKATERIFLPILQILLPEIINMNLPLEGVFHNCVIISIRKAYPGHAKKVMNAIWGLGQMMYTKLIIVVDEDIDPYDLSTVAWKVFNNIDAKRDLVIMEGPLDALDHASPLAHYGHKLGVDATKKWESEGHLRPWPDDIKMDAAIKALVDRRWSEYGL